MASITFPFSKPKDNSRRILKLMEELAKAEEWMEYNISAGIVAPKVEETVYDLRDELRRLRGDS
jgi:hypothetical protein